MKRSGNSIGGVVLQFICTAAQGKLCQVLWIYHRLHMIMQFCSIFKTFSMHLSGTHIKFIEERGRTAAGLPTAPWQHRKWGKRARSHAAKCVHRGKPAQHWDQGVRKHFAMDVHEILSIFLPVSTAKWSLSWAADDICPGSVQTGYGNRFVKVPSGLLLAGRASCSCCQISTSWGARASHLWSSPFNRQCLKNQLRLLWRRTERSCWQGRREGDSEAGRSSNLTGKSRSTRTRRAGPAILPDSAHSPVITRQSIAMRRGQAQARTSHRVGKS